MGLIAAAASVLGAAGDAVNTTAESMWVDYFEREFQRKAPGSTATRISSRPAPASMCRRTSA